MTELGYLGLRPEDDGLPVVVHAADGTVVAYCATRKIAAAALVAANDYYPGEFDREVSE
jgi:hypothetical protein